MKNPLIMIACIVLVSWTFSGCQKQAANTDLAKAQGHTSTSKVVITETQLLVRQWTEWVLSRDISLAPYDDATGAKQYAGQPNATGTMMLAGGSSPDLVNRAITISLAQYQNIFVPLVNSFIYWNDCYPGAPANNVAEGELIAALTQQLNGPRTVMLKLDGTSLVPDKLKDLRANSDFWIFPINSSWDGGCVATSTTFYADGYWAKIPLSLGVHQLEIAGDSDYRRFKSPFSNHVIYTITVTN